MILKSYLLEQNISLINKYFINLIYGENIGMKDDIKDQIKIYFKSYEKILFTQDEILKKKDILTEQVENTSLFSSKKIIFINEVTDKIKDIIYDIGQKPKEDLKIFLFAQTLEKKSTLRKNFEKDNTQGIIACYQDNEKTLGEYTRRKLKDYSGVTQQIINFLIKNCNLDRKTLSNEIDKIKCLFIDKKINTDKLPELLNNNNNLDFNSVRDACFNADKNNLNENLGNIFLQNENAYFYLSVLSNRIEKLINLNYELKKEKNIEKAIDKIKPPIFWKDKPTFYRQIRRWNSEKLEQARRIIFDAEIQLKVNANLNNNILIKNLIINLYQKASSTS
ncbi:DNA polymerase III subunit delta [Pelagibacteraceae bacterium]|nr:DNA polymerase III subunit delta [Pelagibacteraceae bacterium]